MEPFRYRKDKEMPALLVKDSPPGLNDWLKTEAHLNRRSLSQQILVCLEWCMHTYGEARARNPFGDIPAVAPAERPKPTYRTGPALARRLARSAGVDEETAAQMKRDAAQVRKAKKGH